MREGTRRLACRALAPLAVLALAGLGASSCGEQGNSGEGDAKPAPKAETTRAPAAPAAPRPAGHAKPAETTEAKRPAAAKPKETEKQRTEAVDAGAAPASGQKAAEQYGAGQATAGGGQYATDPASPAAQATAAPSSTTLSLTVPKLGLQGVPVVDDVSEAGLSQGAGHLPGTGFPWQGAGSNTYIAGHRLGYPGTPSDHVFYGLPNLSVGDSVVLTDANGTNYDYAVSEVMEVSPADLWVSSPVAGRDVVTLQTCIENFGDEWTPGPDWLARYIVRADRV